MPKVAVYVTPKEGILDPQGTTIERALPALGFRGVKDIRVGRYIRLEVDGEGEGVRETVNDLCRRLLANPIIEDYCFEIEGETMYQPKSDGDGVEEVIVGEDVPVHRAGEHAASPWTAADPYAAGHDEVEKENR